LARALFGRPVLVVLDEPNANLDGDGDRALADAIQMLRNQRVTIVIINHRPNLLSSAQPMTDAIRRGMRED
jgi:ABC-type protease/lipase transport system fused ATPase/permease subunit